MRALFWRPRNLPRLPRAFSSRTSKDLPHQGSREGGSGAVRGVPGSLSGGSFARNSVRRLVSCPRNKEVVCRRSVGCFSRRERSAHIFVIRVERATQKNSQLAPAQRVAMKMGRAAALLVGHVSIQICSLLAPCRRPILIATNYLLFRDRTLGTRLYLFLKRLVDRYFLGELRHQA